jgi:hypothetical protein
MESDVLGNMIGSKIVVALTVMEVLSRSTSIIGLLVNDITIVDDRRIQETRADFESILFILITEWLPMDVDNSLDQIWSSKNSEVIT